MKSPVLKRSIVVAGHKTSVSLEDGFWTGLREIAAARGLSLSEMIATIDSQRHHGNLSSAIRLFVLEHYRGAMRGGDGAGKNPEAPESTDAASASLSVRSEEPI